MEQSNQSLVQISCSALLAGSGQICWKMATIASMSYLEIFLSPWFYFGIGLYVIATVLMILAFKQGDLSVLFAILATSLIWVNLFSIYYFESETLNNFRMMGIVLIFIGCCMLGLQHGRNVSLYKKKSQDEVDKIN